MPRTCIIGETADFQPVRADTPAWEHQLLARDPDAHILRIDTLRSSWSVKGIDIWQLFRIARALRRSDRAIAQSEQSGLIVALARFLSRDRKPLFIIFHGQRWQTRRYRWLARVARLQPGVRFLCLSSSLGEVLTGELGIPPGRVEVTGFGADADFFRPNGSYEPGLIVAAGSASRDYRTLIDAVAGLPVRLEIAADSVWYREEPNVEGCPLPANVTIFSAGDHSGLRDLYARAQFVVVPLVQSRHAAGYAVIAEAMAMGKAVIATRTEAPSDLIEDNVTGLYVPPEDAAALRSAILRLVEQPRLAEEMGAAARQAVERGANVKAYAARLRAAMERANA